MDTFVAHGPPDRFVDMALPASFLEHDFPTHHSQALSENHRITREGADLNHGYHCGAWPSLPFRRHGPPSEFAGRRSPITQI